MSVREKRKRRELVQQLERFIDNNGLAVRVQDFTGEMRLNWNPVRECIHLVHVDQDVPKNLFILVLSGNQVKSSVLKGAKYKSIKVSIARLKGGRVWKRQIGECRHGPHQEAALRKLLKAALARIADQEVGRLNSSVYTYENDPDYREDLLEKAKRRFKPLSRP